MENEDRPSTKVTESVEETVGTHRLDDPAEEKKVELDPTQTTERTTETTVEHN